MFRITLVAFAAALFGGLAAATAGATGDYGSDTCLKGYVWRAARTADHVCVKPAVRKQTRADNAAAASRHVAGSDACITGYVWRAAFPGDVVCVVPAVRRRARANNAAASSRRNWIRASVWRYSAPLPCPQDDPADLNRCAQPVYPAWQLHADHINMGTAFVALYPYPLKGGAPSAKTWPVPVAPASAPGGVLNFPSGVRACSGKPNAVFYIRDPASSRWFPAMPPVKICELPA
jgi:hypothetical protein